MFVYMHGKQLDAFHCEHVRAMKNYVGVRSMFSCVSNGDPVSCSMMNPASTSRVILKTS